MKLFESIVIVAVGVSHALAAYGIQQPLRDVWPDNPSKISPLLALHKSLVEISSVSDFEREASDFVKKYLQDQGFTVEPQTVEGKRQNIFAYTHDSRNSRVLVTSHIDTVPPFWPYERKGDEIWGRGSVDAKGSVAAQIIAVKELLDSQEIGRGDVSLLFVVGEENSGIGMKAAQRLGLSWEAVIFGEPTELKLASGHKGGLGFTITATGKAGHSGYPEQGKNAIDILIKGLAALQAVKLPSSEEFGNSTLNIGTIEGGVAANVIPGSASAKVMIRIAGGELDDTQELIRKAVHQASPDLEIAFRGAKGPVPIDHDIEGFDVAVMNYGTDIPNLDGNHKRYLYGPGTILVAHSDHEHLTVQDLEKAVEGYKILIRETLKRTSGAEHR